ncbi:hypothetical protein Y032_0423g1198 [Ancylostoma ceylanicum]|uniref:Uncharacterized protein n=1 Tax=Ancylostoma ceylanicum TaxID=53326 RepID=A0A016X2W1_9BILA|nr:hypothetical protein Y032_0423g1198 [Ancylostoma ceylanicum]
MNRIRVMHHVHHMAVQRRVVGVHHAHHIGNSQYVRKGPPRGLLRDGPAFLPVRGVAFLDLNLLVPHE